MGELLEYFSTILLQTVHRSHSVKTSLKRMKDAKNPTSRGKCSTLIMISYLALKRRNEDKEMRLIKLFPGKLLQSRDREIIKG
jgi:hypothetical protein